MLFILILNFLKLIIQGGSCFETLGNVIQAESDYKRAIEINPKYNYAIDALAKFN